MTRDEEINPQFKISGMSRDQEIEIAYKFHAPPINSAQWAPDQAFYEGAKWADATNAERTKKLEQALEALKEDNKAEEKK